MRIGDIASVLGAASALLAFLTSGGWAAEPVVSFNRNVRPILASKCFACHGPDEESRDSELRLDTATGAAVDLGGYQAIIPGSPNKSELVARIESTDPDLQMPPIDSGKTLTDDEKKTLRDWIAAGAQYEQHWAFVPPKRPDVPAAEDSDWSKSPIDQFVLARLKPAGLSPSPEADKYTLVRRVYLDLIGLPPTPAEADAFVNDRDPKAYDKLVDRLLQSPHYGERWARPWLDLARYSDTNGYEKDRPRSVWPYRDWVIQALNDDMPFDQFTIEQLAGDMLPDATSRQRIATGFHRMTMLNEEGGIDPLEYRYYAMVDRVATTGTVWLGLTTGCAQCHTHKYDPITHVDYYSLMGLLNNADEPDLLVRDQHTVARRREIEAEIAALEADLPKQFPPSDGEAPEDVRREANLAFQQAKWIDANRASATAWTTLRPSAMETNLPRLEVLDDGSIFSTGDITKRDVFTLHFDLGDAGLKQPITSLRLEVLPDDRLPARGPGRSYYEGRKGDFFLSEVSAKVSGKPASFTGGSESFGAISIGSGTANAANLLDGDGSTGWSTAGREGQPHQLVLNFAEPLQPSGEMTLTMIFERHFAASLGRFRWSATTASGKVQASALPVEIESILAKANDHWTDIEKHRLREHYLSVAPELAAARKKIEVLRKKLPVDATTLVMQERPTDNPRKTHRHHRGEYLQPREEVQPRIPSIFHGLTDQPPTNRLEFARWLVSDGNPLVARVTVNRAWRAFFGHGLIRTSGDFGTQSDPPTHGDLLDWLACEFIDKRWSQKELHRLIVTSATYRQSSHWTPELLRNDPENRMLARSPRLRVDAEMIRDMMLRASGLLSTKIGGPSVYPPQPASVNALAYGNTPWPTSKGADRYRRSLYTFSKRTAPFAAYAIFNAPSGEICTARRDRSNTPLQSLTLLNDEMFLELARALANEAFKHNETTDNARATLIFRRLLTRPPTEEELGTLNAFYQAQLDRLQRGELPAATIASQKNATPELAAWVMVARAVMNLDETITRP